jgi:type II secretory pathway predicted ATPase ExeA
MDDKITFSDILNRVKENNLPIKDTRYSKYNLNFNPFPKSGTANIKIPSDQLRFLDPVNEKLARQIEEYLVATLFAETYNKDDKYMGATIIGNYGSGKTQMLMYVKYLLNIVAIDREYHQNPYAIYIDNPGVKLTELIGKIISEIGEENFKKYLWNKVIGALQSDEYKANLEKLFPLTNELFGVKADPWDEANKVNYKKFIDAWLKNLPTKAKRKEFEEKIQEVIHGILGKETNDSIVSIYLYRILVEDFGINSIWDSITKGEVKQLTGKESDVIKFIVALLYEEGFTHVYVLVDEFEDITRGRLSKSQVDNYLYSLRTLIDKHRNWTIMFAMTQEAFTSLEETSPPLADRITSRKIYITDLNSDETIKLINNYLKLSRTEQADQISVLPFTNDAITEINSRLRGNTRMILSNCFKLLEHAVEKNLTEISESVIKQEVEPI